MIVGYLLCLVIGVALSILDIFLILLSDYYIKT